MTRLVSKSFRVEGIIIAKKNSFEADRVIDILTKEKGRIKAVVRGARKSKSKLAGSSELFIYGHFSLAKGKSLDVLTAATPIAHYEEASNNLSSVSLLFLISEVLTKLLPREVPNEKIFEETKLIFESINKGAKDSLAYEYLYKLVVLLGYGPELSNCTKCQSQVSKEDTFYFEIFSGGVVCQKCTLGQSRLEISKNTLKLLKYIENTDFPKYSKVSFDEKVSAQIQELVNGYLNFIYQRELKSPKFISNVKALK